MKRIFIGSSSEALSEAKILGNLLARPGYEPILWNDYFKPGELTFQALEEGPGSFAGAIFLATPDDIANIRGRRLRIPRTNVLLEFGLFCAVLGRRRVALCVYDGAEIPSDFLGLTQIRMGPFRPSANQTKHSKKTRPTGPDPDAIRNKSVNIDAIITARLLQWEDSLDDVADGSRYATVVHGYSGIWNLHIRYKVWNRIPMGSTDYSASNRAAIYLYINQDGRGRGMGTGRVSVRIGAHYAEFDSTDEFHEVKCLPSGSIEMKSRLVNRRLVKTDVIGGKPKFYADFEQTTEEMLKNGVHGPVDTEWHFEPTAQGLFLGRHKIQNDRDLIVESEIEMSR